MFIRNKISIGILLLVLFGCRNIVEVVKTDDLQEVEIVNGIKVMPNDPDISYMGRIDFEDPESLAYTWPGITIKAEFTGDEIGAIFSGSEAYYSVTIDTNEPKILYANSATPAEYVIETGLSYGSHTLTIVKRNENNQSWSFDPSYFHGLIVGQNTELVEQPPLPTRKIEFIGDSLLTGYGDEKSIYGTGSLTENTNVQKAFPFLTAAHFNSQVQVNAWSGKGLIRNYGDASDNINEAFPAVWPRTLQNSAEKVWDFSWKPSMVVISLGGNDYWRTPGPDRELFKQEYTKLIADIRTKYGDVYIIALWLIGDVFADYIKEVVTADTNEKLSYFEIPTLSMTGQDSHPDLAGHVTAANALIDYIETNIIW